MQAPSDHSSRAPSPGAVSKASQQEQHPRTFPPSGSAAQRIAAYHDHLNAQLRRLLRSGARMASSQLGAISVLQRGRVHAAGRVCLLWCLHGMRACICPASPPCLVWLTCTNPAHMQNHDGGALQQPWLTTAPIGSAAHGKAWYQYFLSKQRAASHVQVRERVHAVAFTCPALKTHMPAASPDTDVFVVCMGCMHASCCPAISSCLGR